MLFLCKLVLFKQNFHKMKREEVCIKTRSTSKLSVKHFELLTQGIYVSWNYTVKQKMHQMCLLLLWKSERRKNNCYLVFADKNEVFLLSNGINIQHGWLLHRKPMFHSRNPKTTGGFQSNRMTVGCKTTTN